MTNEAEKALREWEQASRGASNALSEAAKNLILALFDFLSNPQKVDQYKAAMRQFGQVIGSMPKVEEADARALEHLGKIGSLKEELQKMTTRLEGALMRSPSPEKADKLAPTSAAPSIARRKF